MAGGAEQKVLRWAGLARRYGGQYEIPPETLLGLIEVESGGNEGETSSAGAGGLTQFMPGTAATYDVDVRPGHAESQIRGAAKYLHDLGYSKDPRNALASYNAGPGNPGAAGDYPEKVLAAAKKYAGVGGTVGGTVSAGTSDEPSAPADSDTSAGLFGANVRSGAVRALVFVLIVAAALALAFIGVSRASGAQA